MPETELLARRPDDNFATIGHATLSTRELLGRIEALAANLPDYHYAINLCGDRLDFLCAMFAVIVRGQCNLLPPNKQLASLEDIAKRYPDAYLLHDNLLDSLPDIPAFDLSSFQWSDIPLTGNCAKTEQDSRPFEMPVIDENQLAAISFTSGSTGESRPNIKTWSTLQRGNQINIDNMLDDPSRDLHMVATVPPQHMYGLELSGMLPMASSVCIHSGQPLYPADVAAALEQIPAPRALVSTPQHLRALIASEQVFPPVSRLYSATAPLDQELAKDIEQRFDGTLIEIFGCSEIGSFARRRTATELTWTPFSAMTLTVTDDGNTQVSADHVPEPVTLQDMVTQHPNGRFEVSGRLGDLVNVAGKRGSLAQLNKHLLAIDGVVDGVVFKPETAAEASTAAIPGKSRTRADSDRLAAMVVAPDLSKKDILDVLRSHVDPVFLPRPLLFTDALPRSESSKLPRKALLEHFRALRAGGGPPAQT